ncbi:hypothetical protein [Xylocopilactobacillus apis]|uniref:Lipoprotein n=1 Tax=Xylocopilactobacillus apis TaxID=2932183 RepID=A0AAU9CXZ3_9LACO|nr:hypothetical protein [Xylocopilactobacillus apis]BDR56274.1 hypothetical protein KIMC2_08360 [Xylocopilactobacillus apis]
MKIKKIFLTITTILLLTVFVGCENKTGGSSSDSVKTLRMAESINSSTERIWYVCYTDQNKNITPKTEVGGVIVTKDAKITAYVTAASHKTMKDFNSKKSNEDVIAYAKKLSKKGEIGTAKKKSVIKKDSKVNLYMDITGKKVAGEGIDGITAPGYFMTRVVSNTKVGDYNYGGLKDPVINGGTEQLSYYVVTRLDNKNQKFAFDKVNEKNTKKVYMKSYPKNSKSSSSSSKSNPAVSKSEKSSSKSNK